MNKDLQEVNNEWEVARSSVARLQTEPGFQAIISFCEGKADHYLSELSTATDHPTLLKAQANYTAYKKIIENFTITD